MIGETAVVRIGAIQKRLSCRSSLSPFSISKAALLLAHSHRTSCALKTSSRCMPSAVENAHAAAAS